MAESAGCMDSEGRGGGGIYSFVMHYSIGNFAKHFVSAQCIFDFREFSQACNPSTDLKE